MTAQKHSRACWAMVAAIAVGSLLSGSAAAQDAKALYAQALAEGNSCKKMNLSCQAAKADPKNKEYAGTCDSFRTAMSRSDEVQKNKALDAINKNDLAAATRITNFMVCTADVKQLLTSQIDDAKKASQPVQQAAAPPPAVKADQSSQFLAEARQAFSSGQFDSATSAAGKVTDPNLKPIADDIAGKVGAYRSAVAAARASEAGKDYQGALNNWRTAQGISGNGPEGPAGNIARLEPLARPAAAPQVAANTPPPAAPPPTKKPEATPNKPAAPVDNTAEIARLLDVAGKAERGNDLQSALHAYEGVLRLQATNATAAAGKAGVQAKINSDPAEQAKALAQAIRYFYGSKYPDAEDALRSYLDAPTAKSKGAAYFYLGATRLYEKILSASGTRAETVMASAEIQRPFKDARTAGYQPVERFVSPVVLRAWRSVQ